MTRSPTSRKFSPLDILDRAVKYGIPVELEDNSLKIAIPDTLEETRRDKALSLIKDVHNFDSVVHIFRTFIHT